MSDDDGCDVGGGEDGDAGGRGIATGHRYRVSRGHPGAAGYFLGIAFIPIG